MPGKQVKEQLFKWFELYVKAEPKAPKLQVQRREALAVWKESNYKDSDEIGAVEWGILTELVTKRIEGLKATS